MKNIGDFAGVSDAHLDIKANAEAGDLIMWMMNIDEKSSKLENASCSCCSCCRPMLQSITDFITRNATTVVSAKRPAR